MAKATLVVRVVVLVRLPVPVAVIGFAGHRSLAYAGPMYLPPAVEGGAVGRAAALVSFPVAAAVAGAVFAAVRNPGERARSGLQHFAAGVVFAAVAVEVLPEIRDASLAAVVIGFSAGVALLIGIDVLTGGEAAEESEGSALPLALIAALAVDLLIDGVLVGIGAAVGTKEGRVLTIALTLEVLSLALSLAASLTARRLPAWKAATYPALLSLSVVVGAVGSAALLANAAPEVLAAVLAFGVAALLYLVVEELLVEAHEGPDTPFLTALFFAGFLGLYALEGAL